MLNHTVRRALLMQMDRMEQEAYRLYVNDAERAKVYELGKEVGAIREILDADREEE